MPPATPQRVEPAAGRPSRSRPQRRAARFILRGFTSGAPPAPGDARAEGDVDGVYVVRQFVRAPKQSPIRLKASVCTRAASARASIKPDAKICFSYGVTAGPSQASQFAFDRAKPAMQIIEASFVVRSRRLHRSQFETTLHVRQNFFALRD